MQRSSLASPRLVAAVLGVAGLLGLAPGCGGPPTPMGAVNGTIDGVVVVTAPVAGVVVSAYHLDLATGAPAELLATAAPTAAGGAFHLDLGSASGPILLIARGDTGVFNEPASGVTARWDASTELRAVYVAGGAAEDLDLAFPLGGQATLVISPFSEWALATASARLASHRDSVYGDALPHALQRWRDHLECDFWSLVPADLTSPAGVWDESVALGLDLAALSALALEMSTASASSSTGLGGLDLVSAIDADLGDPGGQLDGTGAGGPLHLGTCPGVCVLSPRTLRARWAEAAADFLGSPANRSGIGVGDALAYLGRLSDRQSDLWPTPGDASFDTMPPTIAVSGLADGDVLHGTVTATVTVVDAIALGEVTITVTRGGAPVPGIVTQTIARPDGRTEVVSLTLRSTDVVDGPLHVDLAATDAAGNRALPVDLGLYVDNSPDGVITGRVVVGGPLVGGRVRAWEDAGGTRGQLLGETVTDDQGLYQLTVADTTVDVIRVEVDNPASGDAAHYLEATTGYDVVFSSTDVIATILTGWTNGAQRTDGVITPFTTIACAFAAGLLVGPLYGGDRTRWSAIVEDAFHVLEDHVADGTTRVALRAVAPADLTAAGVTTFNTQARYGYLLAALGTLADEDAARSNTTPATLNTLTLTTLLAADLGEDGSRTPLLDGRTGAGQLVAGRVTLDSYVTRVDLTTAAVAVFANPRMHLPFTLLDVDPFLDHLAADGNPRLYPASEPPIPYDTIAPTAALAVPTPPDGTVLRGQVAIAATASDNRALATFVWQPVVPDVPGAITASHLDPGAALAGPWTLTGTLDTDLVPEGPVTISALATDEAMNATATAPRTFVIDRTPPLITLVKATTAAGVILLDGAWTGPTTVTVVGTLVEAHLAAATVTVNGATTPLDVGADGAWSVAIPVTTTGSYAMTIAGTDLAGNAATAGPYTFHCDATPPTVTVVASSFLDDTGRAASVTGDGAGTVTWSAADHMVTLGAGAVSFAKEQVLYGADAPDLPVLRWNVADNVSDPGAILLSARVSRSGGTVVLADWFAVPAVPGAGFNRALTVSAALHPDVALVSADYTVEVRATDTLGNTSAVGAVHWTQTILPPPVRQRAGTDGCACTTDPTCPTHYDLGPDACPHIAYDASGILTTPGGLRLAEGVVDNPNDVPVRVTLHATAPAVIRRGLAWENPVMSEGSGPGTPVFCDGDPPAPTLDGGGCYAPHIPGEFGTGDVLDRDLLDAITVTGATLLSAAPGAPEIEIAPHTTATVWLTARAFDFLMPTRPADYAAVGTLVHVTGTVEADWIQCTAFRMNADGSVGCTYHEDLRAIEQLTRAGIHPASAVTLEARPAADSATPVPALGTDVTGFGYKNFGWDSHADGYDPL